jgi:FG-GAP-like repeat
MRARDRRPYAWAAMALSLGVALILVVSAAAARTAAADASFVPATPFDAGLSPTGVAVADFNGDHTPDLAVTGCATTVDPDSGEETTYSDLKILLGDGSGGVRPGTPPPLPPNAVTCSPPASADFNGDGKPDLAVPISSGTAIAILLGDGTGQFAAAPGSPVQVGGGPQSVVAADVNGDGRADLVVPVTGAGGRITGIAVLLGDGSGGFSQAPGSPVSILAGNDISVAVADLDGDGKPDLAVANTHRNEIELLRGDGAGGFGPPTTVGAGRRPEDLAVGDFDGNGKPDLAALVTDGVGIWLGDGSGHFRDAPGSPLAGYGTDLAVADLNGDGMTDIAKAGGDDDAYSVWIATGGGAFRQAGFSPFATVGNLVAIADFDGDGRPDLAAVGEGAPFWPVGPYRSVVLLQTEASPQPSEGRAAHRADSVIATRREISAFAADEKHAAVCAGRTPIAWAPGRGLVAFRTAINGGGCYSDLALGGRRLAWTEYFCGNTECDAVVYVGKLSNGRRKKHVDEEANDCGAGDCYPTGVWVSQLQGGGGLIAWNDWTVECTANCDEGEELFARYAVTRQALVRFAGGDTRSIRHDSAGHPLLAVGGGRMALNVGGRVVVLKPNGARLSSVTAPDVQSVGLSHTELAIAGRSALGLYEPATGHLRKSIALGPAAGLQLAGITSHLALLRGPHALVLVRLSDGALVRFPLAAKVAQHLVGAELTSAGLFYAYNLARGKKIGRIVFEPAPRLLARF